jgi:prepilin signal peptidase PulO-like enzyme (type II secretory pathway)
MEILLLIMVFVLGLCFGSFVNMLVYRIAEKYELESKKFKVKSKNRSYCDYCGKQLKWFENIPVFSWLIQNGKTRCCGKKLPILYPIVEIVTGILFVLFFRSQISDFRFQILFLDLVIIVFLVFSAVFDLKYMILPDFSTIILATSALALWIIGYLGDWSYLWSGLISFGFLGLLYLITKKKGMGLGDVKLAFFMGLFLGYPKVILAFYIAFISGALVALFLMVFKQANRKTLVSFGPFLILGTLVAWFWGSEILSLSVFQIFR